MPGANGQLGMEFREIADLYPQVNWFFAGKEELSITNEAAVRAYCQEHHIHCIINCAAYTAVDLAEQEPEQAFEVNGKAPGILASICAELGIRLFHISTDYVFDGTAVKPYKENDPVGPMNIYGASKLLGEERILQNAPEQAIIIRCSWVFGKYGKNFVKTMLRLMKERDLIRVVNDQQGCPTYAADLAATVMYIITQYPDPQPGIYHYCNDGITNWYVFAEAIRSMTGSSCTIEPIPTSSYPTPARRPAYSGLDTSLIRGTFQLNIPHWHESLAACIARLT